MKSKLNLKLKKKNKKNIFFKNAEIPGLQILVNPI